MSVSFEDDKRRPAIAPPVRRKVDRYDEDGMDDCFEDDIGDQGEIFASDRRGGDAEQVQLTEVSEIFETESTTMDKAAATNTEYAESV